MSAVVAFLLTIVLALMCIGLRGCAASPPAGAEAEVAAPSAHVQHAHHHNDHDHDHDHDVHEDHDHVHAVADEADHIHPRADAAAHDLAHPAFDPAAPCTCAGAIAHHCWCRRCNVGSIAGRRIISSLLFETLDPHGHDIDLSTITCSTCRDALEKDAFCDDCGMGFVEHQAYFTALTHGLARGVVLTRPIPCETCMTNAESSGWCDRCTRGMVGNVAYRDRTIYERTAAELAVLVAAIDRSIECELCACAMVVHRTCPRCLISYERNGDPADGTSGADEQFPAEGARRAPEG